MNLHRPLLPLLLLLCLPLAGQAQRDWTWVFGDSVTMRFPGGGAPVLDSARPARFFEMGACISDSNGDLMMYANNDFIFNSQMQPVSFIQSSSSITQGALVVPSHDPGIVHLFSLGNLCGPDGNYCLRMSRYNARLNGGTGGVSPSVDDVMLYNSPPKLGERLAAVPHANGRDWWLYAHQLDNNWFLRWLVRDKAVEGHYLQGIGTSHATVGGNVFGPLGEMCFSPDGSRLALVSLTGIVDVFDVDRCTGLLGNWRDLGTPASTGTGPDEYYGCSFSPDGSKLYVAEEWNPSGARVFQWDFLAPDLAASKQVVHTGPAGAEFGQMQLGPDGRIYISQHRFNAPLAPENWALSVILSPDSAGAACQFSYGGLPLGRPATTLHLPNLPDYGLPALLAAVAEAAPPGTPPCTLPGTGCPIVVCPGDSVRLGAPAAPGAVYAWRGQGLSDTAAAQPWAAPDTSGWYLLQVLDTAYGAPCGLTADSIYVRVADSAEMPAAAAGADTALCAGDSAVLGAPAPPPPPGGAWAWAWTPQAGLADPDAPLTAASPAAPGGTYVVEARNTAHTGACFTARDTVEVIAWPAPAPRLAGFAGADTAVCAGDTLSLGPGAAAWPGWAAAWSGAGLLDASPRPLAAPAATQAYALLLADSAGGGRCAALADTLRVKVEPRWTHPGPQGPGALCPGGCAAVGTQALPGHSYAWSPPGLLADPAAAATTLHAPPAPGTLALTLAATRDTMQAAGCRTATLTLDVAVQECPWPSLAPPGGALSLGPRARPLALEVWDMAGRRVHATHDYNGGLSLPPGIYIYRAAEPGDCGAAWTGRLIVPE